MTELKEEYENICNKYIIEFCRKQEIEFIDWVGDIVGQIAYCGDFYFNFQDIILDVNSSQPKGLIMEWYYETLYEPKKAINYYSYTKGLRMS